MYATALEFGCIDDSVRSPKAKCERMMLDICVCVCVCVAHKYTIHYNSYCSINTIIEYGGSSMYQRMCQHTKPSQCDTQLGAHSTKYVYVRTHTHTYSVYTSHISVPFIHTILVLNSHAKSLTDI